MHFIAATWVFLRVWSMPNVCQQISLISRELKIYAATHSIIVGNASYRRLSVPFSKSTNFLAPTPLAFS